MLPTNPKSKSRHINFEEVTKSLSNMPECYHNKFHESLTLRKDKKLRIYYDGIIDSFNNDHNKSISRIRTLFPECEIIIGVCLNMSSKGIELLSSLKEDPKIDGVIYPAPWFCDEEFLNEQDLDFVAQDPNPIITIRDYDCYKDLKKIGRFLPIKRYGVARVKELVERVISYKERLMEECLETRKTNLEYDIGRKMMIKMRVKRWIDRLFCKNKEFSL